MSLRKELQDYFKEIEHEQDYMDITNDVMEMINKYHENVLDDLKKQSLPQDVFQRTYHLWFKFKELLECSECKRV